MAIVVSWLLGSGTACPATLDRAELEDIDVPFVGSMKNLNDTVLPMPGEMRPKDRFSLRFSPVSFGGTASRDRSSSRLIGGSRPK